MIFSVIVCTYNRAQILADVLSDLAQQELPCAEYEILIIDNNSTDQTVQVVQEFCTRSHHFRYFLEEKIGLSYARNRGLAEARGLYVAYTDDDCRIPNDWLSRAKAIAKDIKPEIFGGPWLPFYSVPKPSWYQDKYDTYYYGDYPQVEGYQTDMFHSGANIFFLRDILRVCDGFDTNLGMQGGKLGYAEETDAQKRILSRFPHTRVYFDPKLVVKHWVRPVKMSLLWRAKQQYAYGVTKATLRSQKESKYRINSLGKLIWVMISILGHFLISLLKGFMRNRSEYPYFENYYYEVTAQKFNELAYYIYRYRFSKKK